MTTSPTTPDSQAGDIPGLDPYEDSLNVARGILTAILVSAPLWIGILVILFTYVL